MQKIAATVSGPNNKVFVKAASSELGIRSLRYELRLSRAVTAAFSPMVEWDFETDGWLAVAFEHVDGRHANLSPGSPIWLSLPRSSKNFTRRPRRATCHGSARPPGSDSPISRCWARHSCIPTSTRPT